MKIENSAEICFLYIPIILNTKALHDFLAMQDVSSTYVVFNGRTKAYFKNIGLKILEFDSIFTNLDVDIQIHQKIQQDFEKSIFFSPIQVELYDYKVLSERFLYIINSACTVSKKVFLVFLLSDMLRKPVEDFQTFLASSGRNFDVVLSIGKNFSLTRRLKKPVFKKEYSPFPYISDLIKWFLAKKFNSIREKPNLQVGSYGRVGILISAELTSKYLQICIDILKEFSKRKILYVCFTEQISTFFYLKSLGMKVFFLWVPSCFKPTLSVKVGAVTPPILRSYAEGRVIKAQYLMDLLNKLGFTKVLLAPHWSSLGSLVFSFPKKTNLKLISFVASSVDSNAASIIGWEKVDVIYCYGIQCIQAFKARQYPENQLKLSGNFLVDAYLRKRFKRERLILIATSMMDLNEYVWIKEVIKYCVNYNYQCVIKVHPSFPKDHYFGLKKFSRHLKILENCDLNKLIQSCVLCITDCSTIGAEAVLMNRLLLVVNLLGKDFDSNQYAKMGVALEAKTLEEVTIFLDKTINDLETHDFFKSNMRKFFDLYDFHHGSVVEKFIDSVVTD